MNITTNDAYKAMIIFLEKIYFANNFDDIGGLLSDLPLLADGSSADPASLYTWYEVVSSLKKIPQQLTESSQKNILSSDEAFEATREFLTEYIKRTNSPNIESLIKNMAIAKHASKENKHIIDLWNMAIKLVKTNPKEAQEKAEFKLY